MQRYILTAAGYSIKNDGTIIPSTEEPKRTILKPDDLLMDFLILLRECACRPSLYYNGYIELGSDVPNNIRYIQRKIKKELTAIQPFFLAFANKWGLFGLIHDEAMFDFWKVEPDGERTVSRCPTYAIHKVMRPDSLPEYETLEYNKYAARFFPNLQDVMPFMPNDRQFLTQYSETIRDILDSKRFYACVRYIQSIDKQQPRFFTMENVSYTLTINDEAPDIHPVLTEPLVKICQILLFRNESMGRKRIGICHYKRCHRPYLNTPKESGRYSMYCSDECMRNANKARESKHNEQETR